jgi:transcriptional regulator with XRE-family HTH domain
MNWKKKIGERIKAARHAKGFSLTELSEKTGRVLSPSRISNYEQGTRLCKAQDAAILAIPLEVSASHLQCLDIRGGEDDDMSPEAKRLLKGWGALPENERMAYLRRIETLALAYLDPVPDENLTHLAAPTSKKPARKKTARKAS